MLLIDGGVLRNIAVNEAWNMGSDIVIGSYTGSRYSKKHELESITDVLTQLGFSSSINDFREQINHLDYLIEPYTDDIEPTSFESYDTLIMRGYKAAGKFRKEFRKLADSVNTGIDHLPLEPVAEAKYYIIDSIAVNGNKIYSDAQITGVLDISNDDLLGREKITEKIDLLYGKAWFDKVKYRIVPENGKNKLEIDCIEKPRAVLFGSFHYDNAVKAGMILGLSMRDPLLRNSHIEVNSMIGEFYRLKMNYIQFIDRNQKYNLSADFYTDNTLIPKMDLYGETKNVLSKNVLHGLSLHRRLGLNNMAGASARLENITFSRDRTAEPGRKKFKYSVASADLSWHVNTLNSKHFPNRGSKADLSFTASKLLSSKQITDTTIILYAKGDDKYPPSEFLYTIRGDFYRYFTSYKKWTFCVAGELLYTTSADTLSGLANLYFAGGIEPANHRAIPVVGFHPMQLQTNRMASIRLEIDYEVIEKLHLTIMAGATALNEKNNGSSSTILPGVCIGAGYLSVIGPIKAGIMYGFSKNEQYFNSLKGYISAGYNF
jgi:NTE family protein